MKTPTLSRLPAIFLLCFLAFVATSLADSFTGTVSDLDAGNGLLTVTSDVDQSTKTFSVSAETVITGPDGKPSQLMNLIETTRVQIVADGGPGNVATQITVLPDASQQVP